MQDTWQYARLCCEKMQSPATALETLMDITEFYCQWTIKQKQFGIFLDEFLTLPVMLILIDYLNTEIIIIFFFCFSSYTGLLGN